MFSFDRAQKLCDIENRFYHVFGGEFSPSHMRRL